MTTGTGTGKDRIIKVIIGGLVGLVILVVMLGVAPYLSTKGKLILLGAPVGLLVLLAIIGAMSGGGHGTTGSGHGGASGFTVLLAIIAVGAVSALFMEQTKARQATENRRATTPPANPGGVQEFQLVAYPGTNYTPFAVGAGTNMWWVVNHPTESVMYHFNTERPEQDREDSRNGPAIRLPQMKWAYTAHLRAKGLVAVPVTVYLTPIR